MPNITECGNYTTIEEFFCVLDLIKTNETIIISSSNIPLAIIAFLGNVLIIFAFRKPSPLHPASKLELLFGCLASTDLCVGLITQPFFITYLMSPRHLKSCYYFLNFFAIIGGIFSQVSLITMTAISVDRLLALVLGLRYRHVVTLRKVWSFVVTVWVNSTAISMMQLYDSPIANNIANNIARPITAAWLAQLVERRTAVREVVGSNPRPDQHSGSKNN